MIAVSPETVLQENDRLLFAGVVDYVSNLWRLDGLTPDTQHSLPGNRKLTEAVIALHSSLVGRTVKRIRFRTVYEAAIISVHRHGHRIHSRIGDIELQGGDTLLLEASEHFLTQHRFDSDFALVSPATSSIGENKSSWVARIWTMLVLAAVIALDLAGVSDLYVNAFAGSGLLMMTGFLTVKQARQSINAEVMFLIAFAFGVASALSNTGIADRLAESILAVFNGSAFCFVSSCADGFSN